jgi:TonB family protein
MATEGRGVWWRRLTVLSGALLALSVADAQGAGPAPGPRPWAAWAASTTARLHLDGAQSVAFERYLATTAQPSATEKTAAAYREMTSPQRLDYAAANIEASLTKIRVTAAALHVFYATLTPAQRTMFDASMLPHAGHLATGPGAFADEPPLAPSFILPGHVDPDWKVKPTAVDVARVYPAAANASKVSGKVTMSCVADIDGFLTECTIQTETPPGYGFGNAALEISAYMQMRPASNFGVPVRAQVSVPVNFTFPDENAQIH